MNVMHHGGYEAVIVFDEDAGLFHGEVLDLRDVITFQGDSVSALQDAFRDSIEDYLAFCKARGEEPEKPFSGQFVVRADPALHKSLVSAARREGVSLNKLVTTRLAQSISQ
jgi:predicted HicB family RNase H-like nuclease